MEEMVPIFLQFVIYCKKSDKYEKNNSGIFQWQRKMCNLRKSAIKYKAKWLVCQQESRQEFVLRQRTLSQLLKECWLWVIRDQHVDTHQGAEAEGMFPWVMARNSMNNHDKSNVSRGDEYNK